MKELRERRRARIDPPNPSGLCMCGCGEKTTLAKRTRSDSGTREGEPVRYLPGHHFHKSPVPYVVDPATRCWVWQRNLDSKGYGRLRQGPRSVAAYRVYYERAKGAIPEGYIIDHLCRNPACVNPDHLEPVTYAVNSRRGNVAKLTQADVDEIRRIGKSMTQSALAARFGVNQRTIGLILSNKRWRTQD